MTNNLEGMPSDLTMPQLLSFLHKTYGEEAFKQFLLQVNELNRYGPVFSIEKQQETLGELKSLGLHAVADAIESALPHEWQLPHPYTARIWDDDREELVLKWQQEMDAKRKAFEERDSY